MKHLITFLAALFPLSVYAQATNDSIEQFRGIRDNLPPFYQHQANRLNYPLSWLSGKFENFNQWRTTARAKVKESLLQPPPHAPFEPIVIAEEDRGTYIAREIVFNVTADSRIRGYILIPKGKGPFPAVLLLNDHGARFDIGKEKVIEPFNDSTARKNSAREWVKKLYDGKFIGDELAKRGYFCFATDALNWSDRGGAGYEGQQALASNLFNLGMSYAGLIAWEDLYAAEFIATNAEVDSSRIIAMGVSMGAFRAWQLAALSDRIAGSVAVCWMATRTGLLVPGGNLTRGQSSFTTTHPNLANFLDYPDVASIACPKPMLIFNGLHDKLFPISSVEAAYAKMHAVWNSQNAGDQLETKLWDAGHVFNLKMQEEAFLWLDRHFGTKKPH